MLATHLIGTAEMPMLESATTATARPRRACCFHMFTQWVRLPRCPGCWARTSRVSESTFRVPQLKFVQSWVDGLEDPKAKRGRSE